MHLLCQFLDKLPCERESEGIVLCDAPGGGKTVTTVATICRTIPDPGAETFRRVCIVFAPMLIVPM